MILGNGYSAGNRWTINVVAAQTADTLRIDNKTYTFGSASDQIAVGINAETASNIAAKINGDLNNLRVKVDPAYTSGLVVNLAAKTAGVAGNNIILVASGTWANLCNNNPTPQCSFCP